MIPREGGNIFADYGRECAASWRAMWWPWKAATLVGLLGFIFFSFSSSSFGLQTLGILRIVCLSLAIAGMVANAVAGDEFYREISYQACAFAVATSVVLLYAADVFHLNLGRNAASVLLGTWLIGYGVAFARLQRS